MVFAALRLSGRGRRAPATAGAVSHLERLDNRSIAINTPTQRLFLALWPDAVARARLHQHVAGWGWPDAARLYDECDWHVTLHFLGALPQARLDDLGAGLALGFEPFELTLDRPELWPRGIAVLGCAAAAPSLLRLQARLAEALRRLGLPPETRVYRPHLTLARSAAGALAPPDPLPVSWRVRDYALVRSTGDARWRYQRLRHYTALR